MLDRFLRGEEQAEDIHIKVFVELFLGDLFKWRPVVNSGVVDQDVDLAEGLLCCGKSRSISAFLATFAFTAIALPPRFAISSTTRSAPSFEEA